MNATDACPNRSETTFTFTPAANNCEAWVCLRSWKRMTGGRRSISSRVASLTGDTSRTNACDTEVGCNPSPLGIVNTRPVSRHPAGNGTVDGTSSLSKEFSMSIVVRFPLSNATRSQYDSIHDALEKSGDWPAPGCLLHVCFGDEADLHVSEVWESREQLAAFGDTLRPHIEAAGMQMSGEPEVFEVVRFESFAAG